MPICVVSGEPLVWAAQGTPTGHRCPPTEFAHGPLPLRRTTVGAEPTAVMQPLRRPRTDHADRLRRDVQ